MNPLIKLIQINHSFQKSVNLQLDLDNYERIEVIFRRVLLLQF